MKVLIVNTSQQTGGAAIAAMRLMNALNQNGVHAKMLVSKKTNNDPYVIELPCKMMHKYHFLRERFDIWLENHFNKAHLFDIDPAYEGTDITRLHEFKEADIIHLHWINQGMLSISNIRKILQSGKPVVWTLHDMWPFTGICHYAHQCQNFTTHCKNCPLLVKSGEKDLSYSVFQKKTSAYANGKIHFVGCSNWITEEAHKSSLLKNIPIESIPNPINSQKFRPCDKHKLRKSLNLPQNLKYILFTAYRITQPIKGMHYFKEAITSFNDTHPELHHQIGIIAVGKDAKQLQFPYPTFPFGYIENETKMAEIYAASDIFVIPSLQDNLPNTIMEAMASGLPCVGFKVGGIPQMINHLQNGYLANPGDTTDFMHGLEWCLLNSYKDAGEQARLYAVNQYDENRIARLYTDIYLKLLI